MSFILNAEGGGPTLKVTGVQSVQKVEVPFAEAQSAAFDAAAILLEMNQTKVAITPAASASASAQFTMVVESPAGRYQIKAAASGGAADDENDDEAPPSKPRLKRKRSQIDDDLSDEEDDAADDEETYERLTYEPGMICLIKLEPKEPDAPFLITKTDDTELTGYWIYVPGTITYDDGCDNDRFVISTHKALISTDAVMKVWPPELWASKHLYESFIFNARTGKCGTDATAADLVLGWAAASAKDVDDARHRLCHQRSTAGRIVKKYDSLIQTLALCGRAHGNVSADISKAIIVDDATPQTIAGQGEALKHGPCYACRSQKPLSAFLNVSGQTKMLGRACAGQLLKLRAVVRALEKFMLMDLNIESLGPLKKQLERVNRASTYDYDHNSDDEEQLY